MHRVQKYDSAKFYTCSLITLQEFRCIDQCIGIPIYNMVFIQKFQCIDQCIPIPIYRKSSSKLLSFICYLVHYASMNTSLAVCINGLIFLTTMINHEFHTRKRFNQKIPNKKIYPFPFCHTLPFVLEKCAVELFIRTGGY